MNAPNIKITKADGTEYQLYVECDGKAFEELWQAIGARFIEPGSHISYSLKGFPGHFAGLVE